MDDPRTPAGHQRVGNVAAADYGAAWMMGSKLARTIAIELRPGLFFPDARRREGFRIEAGGFTVYRHQRVKRS